MYQAIVTKWLGPTNFRGSRIKATAAAGSVVVSWDYGLNVEANHAKAAEALCVKLGWIGENYSDLIGGGMPDGSGYCFVFTGGKA